MLVGGGENRWEYSDARLGNIRVGVSDIRRPGK
jgi:hypothetical protein